MSTPESRWYFDASVIIKLLEGQDGAHEIQRLVNKAKSGEARIICSALMLVEVSRERNSPVNPARIAHAELFFENDYITILDLHPALARKALNLMIDRLWLRNHDAVHLATATEAKCTVFYTNDEDLCQKIGDDLGFPVIRPGDPVPVREGDYDLPLFSPMQDDPPPI